MAELVLEKAGAAIGAALLPKGLSFLGGVAGRLAGAALEARFLSPPIQGPRVRDFHLTEGREGAGIPVVYGRCRIGGQLIWAAEFKERREVEGGKGGPRVANYSYSLSFAVALCEGEVVRVARCWANGEPFDLSQVTWRLHSGSETQAPDPLIEAVEGAGSAPAYRGVAYIVFEDMPVDQFGARMPQLSFEVIKPAAGSGDRLETLARAVNVIPGSGEFALATDIVRRRLSPGWEVAENQHGPEAKSDFEASLDHLEAELPNVSRVNLVAGWFGSDLRCGECLIQPGVEAADKITLPLSWSVAGIGRGDAYVVSATDGRSNYGGTPSDDSVRQAVQLLKARGYHVTLYPFLLMDIVAGNGLTDPYGESEQAAFPWRGRIRPTGDDEAQIDAFFERYRNFILHYAEIADDVGADGILIGSELTGLTHASLGAVYPAVQRLRELAQDVRAVVGSGVEISYAADWTEYGAHVAGADVAFPLDALWADAAIDYVGLDWYAPMADWRDGDGHADEAARDGRSLGYLGANIAAGEAFDWYYPDQGARLAQDRAAISDGGYGEPWVFRQKDITGWWSSEHRPRTAGVRSPTPTGWVAGMKPVRFVEMGCPAVDKGANQPNVFYDPKSSESGLPHFSDGSRDDVVQRRAIEAFHLHWREVGNNPVSAVYGGAMTPDDGVALWAWDARPFPAFPARDDAWGDAGNWRLGHWLNGRVGLALLPDVVADICERVGVSADVGGLSGILPGYTFYEPSSARSVLEPLSTIFAIDATEREGEIAFRMRGEETLSVDPGRLVEEDGPAMTIVHAGLEGSDARVRLRFVDSESDHGQGVVISAGVVASEIVDLEAAIEMDRGQAQACADMLAQHLALQREQARFAMSADGMVIEAGDVVTIGGASWRIVEVSQGVTVSFEAVRASQPVKPMLYGAEPVAPPPSASPVEPDVVIVDGPPLPGQEDDLRPLGFAFADLWSGPVIFKAGAAGASSSERGTIERPCSMGRLVSGLYPHASGRWQETSIWVRASGVGPSSRDEGAVLNGANTALVETGSGWEMVQFLEAELVDVETYRLTGLLRGQQGSDDAMAAEAESGARIVFLTGAEQRLEVDDWERGLALQWRAGRDSPAAAVWQSEMSIEGHGGRPWAPCHLTVTWVGDDLSLGWIRRARKGGDPWASGEPVQEWPEAYCVRISGGVSVREWNVDVASAAYLAGDQATDFPVGGVAFIEVGQVGPDGQPGGWVGLELTIPVP